MKAVQVLLDFGDIPRPLGLLVFGDIPRPLGLLVFGDIPRPLGQGAEVGVAPLVDGSLHSFKAGRDKTRSKVLLAV